ncbi:hypothetical protein WJ438_05855 [Streptomyces sp. GD-15H]|uniref:hypothetical protein n=1 Tax=Streptomyces sp. GD-15H TaxID=3129112 RepID=UPI003250E416
MSEHHEQHRVSWRDEYPLPDLGGRPDYAVSVDGGISGYVELKRPGLPVDPGAFGRGNREQWDKLRDLPNLLYSNGTEWWLFRGGRQVGAPRSVTRAHPASRTTSPRRTSRRRSAGVTS